LITGLITGLVTALATGLVTALATGSAPVLITGLASGLAGLPSNLDYSRNVAHASHSGGFHPDGIPEIPWISKTGAGGFVRVQIGYVAGCHQSTEIILA